MIFFHIHTYRCGHAENIPDEAYIKAALEMGARDIWFTDHAPFPGDPFGARMKYTELDEYLETLTILKNKCCEIAIHIGLETEYFPNFDRSGYYQYLRSRPEIEILLLGQHMAEVSADPIAYSFSESFEYLNQNEYKHLGTAIVQGIQSGYFDAVAHPDRIFRRCGEWNESMSEVSKQIISAAVETNIPFEMNLASAENSIYQRKQFWRLVPIDARRIIGFDAHTIYEMKSRYKAQSDLLKRFEVQDK